MEFQQTLGGRGSSPTRFSSCLRTIQIVGVFGDGKAVCFGPPEWDRKLEILDCLDCSGWAWRLPSVGLDCEFVMIFPM